jgi:hypothetical protein
MCGKQAASCTATMSREAGTDDPSKKALVNEYPTQFSVGGAIICAYRAGLLQILNLELKDNPKMISKMML